MEGLHGKKVYYWLQIVPNLICAFLRVWQGIIINSGEKVQCHFHDVNKVSPWHMT